EIESIQPVSATPKLPVRAVPKFAAASLNTLNCGTGLLNADPAPDEGSISNDGAGFPYAVSVWPPPAASSRKLPLSKPQSANVDSSSTGTPASQARLKLVVGTCGYPIALCATSAR